jgi:NAD(P)-dependent dehydrogenase (short-subunit alcohol dehydrogenase family)
VLNLLPSTVLFVYASIHFMAKKIVAITGVTRGLGRAMVAEFARLGHTVLGCGRSRKEIERLETQFPAPHRFSVVDVASDEAVKAWAESVLGPPDRIQMHLLYRKWP